MTSSKLRPLPPIAPLLPKICPYPPCKKLFNPIKSNQIYCCPKHTSNMQMARYKAKKRKEAAAPMFTPDEIRFLTRHNLKVIITSALQADISGTQICTWVDEILINEVDHYPQEPKGTPS